VGGGIGVSVGGGGTGVSVGGTGVSVGAGTGVSVGVGRGVSVAVGCGLFVAVGTGVSVDPGSGVLVGVGVGVGAAFAALPCRHPAPGSVSGGLQLASWNPRPSAIRARNSTRALEPVPVMVNGTFAITTSPVGPVPATEHEIKASPVSMSPSAFGSFSGRSPEGGFAEQSNPFEATSGLVGAPAVSHDPS
jgi:hypothetical protein